MLLFTLSWIAELTNPLITIFGHEIYGRDLVLIFLGLFLLAKSTHEIHSSFEYSSQSENSKVVTASFYAVITQGAIIDIVFSLDSVITAVGLVQHISIMVLAILISVAIMLVAAKPIGEFVDNHPTIKMLALAF